MAIATKHSAQPLVCGWRWRIAGGSPLSVRDTLTVGHATRSMLTEASRWSRGSPNIPLCLHGPTPDHSHARYLPEDEDGDGVIDHLTVYATGGLDGSAIRLLAISERVFVPGHGAHDLEPIWMGQRPPGAMFGRSAEWVSRTPWVAPWYKDRTDKQVRRELPSIGVPPTLAATVQVREAPAPAPADGGGYLLERLDDRPPSPPRARMLHLVFSEVIDGPIALGFGSHFGLGQLVAKCEAGEAPI